MSAARFLVRGRVQGVAFRAHAQRKARALGLTGHARNRPDGSVEVLAFGEDAALDAFADWLAHGPPLARVEAVERAAIGDAAAPDDFVTG